MMINSLKRADKKDTVGFVTTHKNEGAVSENTYTYIMCNFFILAAFVDIRFLTRSSNVIAVADGLYRK